MIWAAPSDRAICLCTHVLTWPENQTKQKQWVNLPISTVQMQISVNNCTYFILLCTQNTQAQHRITQTKDISHIQIETRLKMVFSWFHNIWTCSNAYNKHSGFTLHILCVCINFVDFALYFQLFFRLQDIYSMEHF